MTYNETYKIASNIFALLLATGMVRRMRPNKNRVVDFSVEDGTVGYWMWDGDWESLNLEKDEWVTMETFDECSHNLRRRCKDGM